MSNLTSLCNFVSGETLNSLPPQILICSLVHAQVSSYRVCIALTYHTEICARSKAALNEPEAVILGLVPRTVDAVGWHIRVQAADQQLGQCWDELAGRHYHVMHMQLRALYKATQSMTELTQTPANENLLQMGMSIKPTSKCCHRRVIVSETDAFLYVMRVQPDQEKESHSEQQHCHLCTTWQSWSSCFAWLSQFPERASVSRTSCLRLVTVSGQRSLSDSFTRPVDKAVTLSVCNPKQCTDNFLFTSFKKPKKTQHAQQWAS